MNVALKRSTVYQSSINWGGDPFRAVDGNTDGNYNKLVLEHYGLNGTGAAVAETSFRRDKVSDRFPKTESKNIENRGRSRLLSEVHFDEIAN